MTRNIVEIHVGLVTWVDHPALVSCPRCAEQMRIRGTRYGGFKEDGRPDEVVCPACDYHLGQPERGDTQ